MKKLLRFLLLASLMVPIGVRAQLLTVAGGETSTNSYIPIYGYYVDAQEHNQVLYSSNLLTEMQGNYITTLSWYLYSTPSGMWNATATIKMGIVTDTAVTALLPDSALTTVWTGLINPIYPSIDIILDSAFHYTGGNLLVDISIGGGAYSGVYFWGENTTTATAFYSYTSLGSTYGYSQQFLPKTTFAYNATGSVCRIPSNVTLDASTLNSISFHWTPAGSESAWDVMVGDSLIAFVTDTFITVGNLASSSSFDVSVRAICGVGDIGMWSLPVSFATACGSISSLPWSYGFEDASPNATEILCWTIPQQMAFGSWSGDTTFTPYINPYSYYAHSGNYGLYFTYYNSYGVFSNTAVLATPYIAHNPADLHITFWANASTFQTGAVFEGGVMSNPADTSTFIPLFTLTSDDFAGLYGYNQYEFYTAALTGFSETDSVCVAFRIDGGTTSSIYFYMDDIAVDVMGDCLPPILNSGHLDSLSYESVQLSWSTPGEPDGFDVRLVNTFTMADTHLYTPDTNIFILDLEGNTTYSAYVASICGDDTSSYIFAGTFTTHLRCYTVQDAEVVALTANAAAIAWDFANMGIESSSVELLLTNLSDPTEFPVAVTVEDANSYTFMGLTNGNLYQLQLLTVCNYDDSSSVVTLTFMPHTPPCGEVSGTGSNAGMPFYSYQGYGFSESLYEASLIAGVDTITGITLGVHDNNVMRDHTIDIWMGYTALSNIVDSTAYVPVSQMTHVVSNYTLTIDVANAPTWTDLIPFDTVFVNQPANDSLNLVIAIYNHTGGGVWGLNWGTHISPVGTTAFSYLSTSFDPNDPWSTTYIYGSPTAEAPNVQFFGSCGGGDCTAPSMTVSSIDATSATLTWIPGGNEESWTVQYREDGTSTWITAATVITQPYTVTGLAVGTVYQFRIGSNCTDTVVYSTAVNATTLCGAMPTPISITPNGENNCWSYMGDGHYAAGEYTLYNNGLIVSPELADDISTLQVKVTGYGEDIYVGVCDAAGANPEWLDTITFPTGEYYNVEARKIYLHHYTGEKKHIILRGHDDYNYTYINNITIEPLDNCMFVENLHVDSLTTNDAWLSWISDGNNFEVQYMAESDATGTWLTATTTTNSIHLTGLNSNDHYQIKVFNICSATERSDSVAMRMASGCELFTIPFLETFGGSELPVCWNTLRPTGGNGTSWGQSVTYVYYNYISSNGNNDYTPADDWLMTPMIQLPTDASNCQLILNIGGGPESATTVGSNAAYEVYVSTTGNGNTANYTLIYSDTAFSTVVNNTYQFINSRISLAGYNGQAVSLAIRNMSVRSGRLFLREVSVRNVAEPLYSIEGTDNAFINETTTYYAIHEEGALDSMTLSWTSSMADAGLATATGYNSDSLSIVYLVEGVDTLTLIATNSYGSDTVRYVVYVYDCSPLNVFPYYESFESTTAPAGCWSLVYADNNPSVNAMLHVTVDEDSYLSSVIDGERAFRFSSFSTSPNYNQYLISRELDGTNRVLSFWYSKGGLSTSDQIRVGYSSTTNDTSAFTWGAWINPSTNDWAQFTDSLSDNIKYVAIQYWGSYAYYMYIDNFVITGTGNVCGTPGITGTSVTETSATVVFTGDAATYEFAIVEGSWDESALTIQSSPLTTYTFSGLTASTLYTIGVRAVCVSGRTSEWVTVTVTTDAHPCYTPTNVNATNITMEDVTITWTPGEEGQTEFEAHVYAAGDDNYVYATGNSVIVDELFNNTEYTVVVRAVCGEGNYSDWSTPVTFRTVACQPISSLNVTPAATSAVVTWMADGNQFELEYGIFGTSRGQGTRVSVSGTTYTITDLEPETNYQVSVRTVCGENAYSDWSDVQPFTTEAQQGIDDVDNAAISLYPNPASSTVTLTGIDGEATVTVVDMNGREIQTIKHSDNQAITIDVSQLAQGAYFVRIAGERVNAIRKLIVR